MEVLARNLKAAMERHYDGVVNQSALARDSGVAQKGISNYLSANKPENKPHLDDIPSPSLETLCKLAEALNIEAWELLHPDPEKARREQQFYERIEKDFRKLPPIEDEQVHASERRKMGRRKSDVENASLDRAKARGAALLAELDRKKHKK